MFVNDFLRVAKLPRKSAGTVNGHWVCTTALKTKGWPHLSLSTGKAAVVDGKELAPSESATEDEELPLYRGQMNKVSESLNGIKWDVKHPLV